MKLNILLCILVAEISCQPIDGEHFKTPQFGKRLSIRKEQSDGGNPNKQNNGEDIRSKRGHNFAIGGHTPYGIANKGGIYSSPIGNIGNTHGLTIPVLGPSLNQASPSPFITYGSATLTRTSSNIQQPLRSTSKNHDSPLLNQHSAATAGRKDSETIKRLSYHGYKKTGAYSDHHGYAPGKGYYYGK